MDTFLLLNLLLVSSAFSLSLSRTRSTAIISFFCCVICLVIIFVTRGVFLTVPILTLTSVGILTILIYLSTWTIFSKNNFGNRILGIWEKVQVVILWIATSLIGVLIVTSPINNPLEQEKSQSSFIQEVGQFFSVHAELFFVLSILTIAGFVCLNTVSSKNTDNLET